MNSAAEETFFFALFAGRAEGAAEVKQNIGFVRLQLYLMRFKHDVIHFQAFPPIPPEILKEDPNPSLTVTYRCCVAPDNQPPATIFKDS